MRIVYVLAGATGVLLPAMALASASFTDTWFPHGNIEFFIKDDAEVERDTIVDTMTYMADHSPLSITEVGAESSSNLQFGHDGILAEGSGMTYAYWDENRSDTNQQISMNLDDGVSRGTVTHEFGHALGKPHEFQRDDRDDHVDVCFNVDPFNYSELGSAFWPDPYENLSPYDFGSIMNSGYSDCVTPHADETQQTRSYEGVTNLLSVHDVNGIYRMYGEPLGANDDGDRFGVAVASGDFDDDGYKDVVVANVQTGNLWLTFFRGVALDASEGIDGIKFMPWFKEEVEDTVDDDAAVSFAVGDFNGDGIDDLAMGQPDYDGNRGRVSLLFVNTLPSDTGKDSFEDDFAPWGRKGIQHRIDLGPADFGLPVQAPAAGPVVMFGALPRLGASLAAVRATNYRNDDDDLGYHDLAIGAPNAKTANLVVSTAKGAVVLLKGSTQANVASFSTATYTTIWNPNNADEDFGAAVSALPGLCALSGQTAEYYDDFLAIGAPAYNADRGSVHVYGCATSGFGLTLSAPTRKSGYNSTSVGSRYGHALAGFRIRSSAITRTTYLAIGQPGYVTSGLSVGRVALDSFSTAGARTNVTSFVPGTRSGDDEFGYALAIAQRPYTSDITDEGGRDTTIGIGMPGTEVDGVVAGKLYAWRPFNSDGSINSSATVISALDPDASVDTRFGHAVATLRPLKAMAGFVVGAPDGLAASEDRQAGMISTLQNEGADFAWDSRRWNHDQESEGDKRTTNR